MKIFVDMDGVLVDFVGQVERYGCWKEDGEVDWDKVVEIGSTFWQTMDWYPGAEEAFMHLMDMHHEGEIDLHILSAVDYDVGIEGKRKWLKAKTGISEDHAHLVHHSREKADFASPEAILIDDRDKCIKLFKDKGGKAIHFTSWEAIDLEKLTRH